MFGEEAMASLTAADSSSSTSVYHRAPRCASGSESETPSSFLSAHAAMARVSDGSP